MTLRDILTPEAHKDPASPTEVGSRELAMDSDYSAIISQGCGYWSSELAYSPSGSVVSHSNDVSVSRAVKEHSDKGLAALFYHIGGILGSRAKSQVAQSVVGFIHVFMVNFHPFLRPRPHGNRPCKSVFVDLVPIEVYEPMALVVQAKSALIARVLSVPEGCARC